MAPEAPATFFGSVELDSLHLASSAGTVGTAILQHLTGLLDAEVKVRLEIEAHVEGGVPDNIVRIVTENASTLKFRTAELE